MPKIGLQLWTIRDVIEQDLESAIQRVAEIGYAGVETATLPAPVSMQKAASLLKEAQLEVFAAHIDLPTGEHQDVMLRTAEAYQCKNMIWHGWPESELYDSADGLKKLVDTYNEANHIARSNGLRFGLHNHWWEFEEHDGIVAFDYFLEHLDPAIFFEIDIYWAKVAGRDPAQAITQFGARAPYLHIKDGPARWTEALDPDNLGPMVAVGGGTQNIPAIVDAASHHTEWMIVELDQCATDMLEAVEDSYSYLSSFGLEG